MFIQTETTADPRRLRFLPGRAVTGSGTVTFASADEATGRAPLAEAVLAVPEVASVTLGPDWLDVTLREGADWEAMRPVVLRAVMEHAISGAPALAAGATREGGSEDSDNDEAAAEIKALIATRIAPAVAQSGGNVVFRGLEDGVVLLELEGPAVGLRQGIETMLRHYVPEVQRVVDYEEHTRMQRPELNTPEALAIRRLLEEEVNPAVASHGGRIALIDVGEDTVYIRLEGGCQGCGMADVTLKQGVEVAIRRAVPSITRVLDVTDHAGGANPYYQPGKGGASPM